MSLNPDQIKELKELERHYTKFEELAEKLGVSVDDLSDEHLFDIIEDKEKLPPEVIMELEKRKKIFSEKKEKVSEKK